MKINRYLLSSTLVVALGSFMFGFDEIRQLPSKRRQASRFSNSVWACYEKEHIFVSVKTRLGGGANPQP
jgi:hypothetical protein